MCVCMFMSVHVIDSCWVWDKLSLVEKNFFEFYSSGSSVLENSLVDACNLVNLSLKLAYLKNELKS